MIQTLQHSMRTAWESMGGSSVASSANNKKNFHWRIFQTLVQHVWPNSTSYIHKEDEQAIRKRKQRVVFSLGLLLTGKGVTIQVPFLFKYLVDALPSSAETTAALTAAASSSDPALLGAWPLALLLGYGVSRAASSGFHELRNAIFMHVAQDAIRMTGRTVFDHVLKLDLQFHLNKNTGKVARILDRGQRSIQFVLNAMVFHIVPTILEVSLVSGLLAWQFGVAHANVALATVASYMIFTVGITQWRTQFRRDMNRLENQASSRVVDSLVNYETVQYFNNVSHEGKRYEESLKGYQQAALQAQTSLGLLNVGQAAIFSTGMTALMYLTSQQVLNGTATAGDLVLVNGLLFQLSVPLFFIGSVYREVRQSLIDMEHMYEILDTPSNLKPPVDENKPPVIYDPATMGADLAMENVYFSYPTRLGGAVGMDQTGKDSQEEENTSSSSNDDEKTRSILQGASLMVPQGSTVAIVGSSGCGKSTLLRLWYRFYDASAGRILVGGQDVRDLDLDSLRRNIAVIPQDVVLFHESVRYNLQYGDLEATDEQVEHAAQQAQIHDTIANCFPKGYDTVVGERGLKLSGGEKQRMAIARAILKLQHAPILLCDEPTSSLDSVTESQIMQNIKSIGNLGGERKTIVMIAHRLSTIQDCDLIIVMEQGCVVEQGTHGELLALQGRYSELWRRQEAAGATLVDP